MEKDTVVKICGEYPDNFKPADVGNNSNFVFVNDPSYLTVQLYDIEENTVFVNSFIECEHYVSGGWNYSPYETKEASYYTTISITLIFGIIIYSFINKYMLKVKND
tara:strand:- start:337 stop:654 length:318 start_codon:yes stop_codon:yes gene_type:complete